MDGIASRAIMRMNIDRHWMELKRPRVKEGKKIRPLTIPSKKCLSELSSTIGPGPFTILLCCLLIWAGSMVDSVPSFQGFSFSMFYRYSLSSSPRGSKPTGMKEKVKHEREALETRVLSLKTRHIVNSVHGRFPDDRKKPTHC